MGAVRDVEAGHLRAQSLNINSQVGELLLTQTSKLEMRLQTERIRENVPNWFRSFERHRTGLELT